MRVSRLWMMLLQSSGMLTQLSLGSLSLFYDLLMKKSVGIPVQTVGS